MGVRATGPGSARHRSWSRIEPGAGAVAVWCRSSHALAMQGYATARHFLVRVRIADLKVASSSLAGRARDTATASARYGWRGFARSLPDSQRAADMKLFFRAMDSENSPSGPPVKGPPSTIEGEPALDPVHQSYVPSCSREF